MYMKINRYALQVKSGTCIFQCSEYFLSSPWTPASGGRKTEKSGM